MYSLWGLLLQMGVLQSMLQPRRLLFDFILTPERRDMRMAKSSWRTKGNVDRVSGRRTGGVATTAQMILLRFVINEAGWASERTTGGIMASFQQARSEWSDSRLGLQQQVFFFVKLVV